MLEDWSELFEFPQDRTTKQKVDGDDGDKDRKEAGENVTLQVQGELTIRFGQCQVGDEVTEHGLTRIMAGIARRLIRYEVGRAQHLVTIAQREKGAIRR